MTQRGHGFDRLARKSLTAASVLLFGMSSTMLGVRAANERPASTPKEKVAGAPVPRPATAPDRPQRSVTDPGCGPRREVPGIGTSCETTGGLQRVFIADGSTVTTHGGDATPALGAVAGRTVAAPADIFGALAPPPCATDLSRDSFVRAIYAFPSDRPDHYTTADDIIIETVSHANAGFRAGASTIAGLRFACSGSRIRIDKVKLPTTSTKTTFATVVGDLRAVGYKSTHEKYLVFLDYNLACGCAGLGSFHTDDRASLQNVSNSGPDFAVIMQLAHEIPMVVLHELGHTLGAVQLSSRNSSGAAHCNDGFDVMCYDDHGPRARYITTACATMVFDCGTNDYFDPAPATGSYLASHWNLGSRLNRYLVFRAANKRPEARALSCDLPASEADERVACSFSIADDSPALSYTVEWGDGTTTGDIDVEPGTFHVSHTWPEDGAFAVRVTVRDESLASAAVSVPHKVATCRLDRSGTILLGAQNLLKLDGVDAVTLGNIATGCGGYPFSLSTGSGDQIDICWMAGETQMSCTDRKAATITGIVPNGATAARLLLYAGLNSSYHMRAPVR